MDLQTILSMLGENGTTELTKKTGANKDQVTTLIQNALPTLLSTMKSNASNEDGVKGLSKALDDHAGDDISDIGSFLKNVDMEDGSKILSKVFGSKTETVKQQLSDKSGLTMDQVTNSLASIAPLLLSMLGKEKKAKGNTDVTSMLGGLLGGDMGDLAGDLLKGVGKFFK